LPLLDAGISARRRLNVGAFTGFVAR
jgi:hypothetical protein